MKLIVGKYIKHDNYHQCTDEYGKVRRIDVWTDGGLVADTPEDLEGATIYCENITPYIELAHRTS